MAEKDADAFSDSEGPVSTFASLFAEGDGLSKQGDYQKAVDAFTKVWQPNSRFSPLTLPPLGLKFEARRKELFNC